MNKVSNVCDFQIFQLIIFSDFLYRDCSVQTDQVVFENKEQHCQTIIHFNDLIIDVNKGIEIAPPETNTNTMAEGEIRRTFK
jgi:hypothetical protein